VGFDAALDASPDGVDDDGDASVLVGMVLLLLPLLPLLIILLMLQFAL